MSKIYFKGNMPPLEVSPGEAGLAQHAVENGKSGDVINVGHLTVRVSEIKGVVVDPVNTGESDETRRTREWHEDRRALAKKPVPEKVEWFIKHPALILFNLFGREIEPELRERLAHYYTENPTRCYPEWSTFKGLYPESRPLNLVEGSMLRILIQHINSDFDAVKRDKEYDASVLGLKPEELPEENKPPEVINLF